MHPLCSRSLLVPYRIGLELLEKWHQLFLLVSGHKEANVHFSLIRGDKSKIFIKVGLDLVRALCEVQAMFAVAGRHNGHGNLQRGRAKKCTSANIWRQETKPCPKGIILKNHFSD